MSGVRYLPFTSSMPMVYPVAQSEEAVNVISSPTVISVLFADNTLIDGALSYILKLTLSVSIEPEPL